jgi:hypothetical protein
VTRAVDKQKITAKIVMPRFKIKLIYKPRLHFLLGLAKIFPLNGI